MSYTIAVNAMPPVEDTMMWLPERGGRLYVHKQPFDCNNAYFLNVLREVFVGFACFLEFEQLRILLNNGCQFHVG